MPPPEPTLRMIARRAGVSVMTVSLALRNSPQVSVQTRERLQALARRMGYRSNPLVSAWLSHVRRKRTGVSNQIVLAWINESPDPEHWRVGRWRASYFRGAEQRAGELGCRLEEFHLGEFGPPGAARTLQRLLHVLHHRAIQGVVLPLLNDAGMLRGDWTRFAVALASGHTIYTQPSTYLKGSLPQFHQANPDFFYNLSLAWMTLQERGCCRIGLVLVRAPDRPPYSLQRAAYLGWQALTPAERQVCYLELPDVSPSSLALLLDWFEKQKLDGLLTDNPGVLIHLRSVNVQVPSRVRVALLSVTRETAGVSGIDMRSAEVSAAAIDLVVAQLHRNESGIPRVAHEVLVQGKWVEGATA